MASAVTFENVSKRYHLGTGRPSFGESISGLASRLVGGGRTEPQATNVLWALNDVSFAVEPGQVLGLIGQNGSGKTTTLKVLSGITRPTSGRVNITGRVSALIELGAGFHPDLSGRENIFLNGVILGLSRKEIARKFDKIVAFAELERFIDTPVKRYSSGMYARLAFAVAAHVDPDVLLVDEVLAVGDENFQRKCYDYMHRFVASGKSAIFVSHNMFVAEQLCNKLIWLRSGKIELEGPPGEVLPRYFDWMEQRAMSETGGVGERGSGPLTIVDVSLFDCEGNVRNTFAPGEDVVVQLKYQTDYPIPSPHFCVSVRPSGGSPLFLASMLVDGQSPTEISGTGVVRCRFKATPLMPKVYEIWAEVYGSDRAQRLVLYGQFARFRVVDRAVVTNGAIGKGGLRHSRADAAVRVSYEWEY